MCWRCAKADGFAEARTEPAAIDELLNGRHVH
jgi:hypothetical protein